MIERYAESLTIYIFDLTEYIDPFSSRFFWNTRFKYDKNDEWTDDKILWFLQNDMNMRNTCKFYMVITSWCNLYLMCYYWKSPYIYHLFECFRIIFQLFLSTIATFPTACYYFTIIYQYYYNILRGHLFNPFMHNVVKWPNVL